MNKQNYPNPNTLYPIEGVTRTIYLKNIITNPQIIVGDYTYYDDPEDVYNFEKKMFFISLNSWEISSSSANSVK